MKKIRAFFLIALASSILPSCGLLHKTGDRLTAGLASTNLGGGYEVVNASLNSQALTLISSRCNSCHSSSSSGLGGYRSSDSLDQMVRDAMVIPGNAAISRVYIRSIDNSMPPAAPMTQMEKDLIKNWIDTGLKPSSTGGPAPTPTPVFLEPTFASISRNILVPKCVYCHGSMVAKSRVRYDTYQFTLETVRPGQANESELYKETVKTGSGVMPPPPAQHLNQLELQAIRDWINSRALNN
jgi:uncharacterized membrane protein